MITVKDIREKDFSLQKRGYSEDEVDDFLDAIADQLGGLIRENREYLQRAEKAEQERDEALKKLDQAKQAPAPAVEIAPVKETALVKEDKPALPAEDESAYFENLKATLRETLLSAQRIAGETVSEAKKKADAMISDADSYASQVREKAASEAQQLKEKLTGEVSGMQQQLETLKSDMQTHKAKFVDMIKSQLKALGEDDKDAGENNAQEK